MINVSLYTGREQTEQPAIIHNVTAISVVDGLLTVECDVKEKGVSYSAHHRFEKGSWTHFTTNYYGEG